MATKTTIFRKNRTFDVYVYPIGSGMAEITIYEVIRPNRKFFRTKFFPFHSCSVFVEDFPTITAALFDCVDAGLRKEARTEKLEKMWKEFEENT